MHRQRFERVRALFLAALRQPDGEARARFLDGHAGDCRGDVEALLRGHAVDDTFLLVPPGPGLVGPSATALSFGDLLFPGDRVAEYLIEAPLGRGGYGTVYRAEQLSMRRVVALKVIPMARLRPAERRRVLREASLAAAIDAPHLVKVHASGQDEDRGLLYLAMQFVDGPDLATVLSRTKQRRGNDPLVTRRMVERCMEVGRALAALHGARLVHRDVKPANVVLEGGVLHEPGSGTAVLVDLGLVRHLDAPSSLSALAGTYAYLAPEVLAGQAAEPAADVFALGLLLFDAVSGRDPAARAAGMPPPWLRTVDHDASADLEAVVARATMPRPGARYRDAGEVADDLQRWLAGRAVVARRVGRFARAARFARENPALVARRAAITCAAVLLGAAAVFGADHALRTLSRTEQARAALAAGQLDEHVTLARGLPGWALARLDDDPSGEATRHALQATVATLRTQDRARALRLAAAYLQRDGLAAHPQLAAFLANAANAHSAEGGHARRLCALLFHDRPDLAPADVTASTPVRAAMEQRLLADPHDPFALAALGGCGDAATFASLVGLARSTGPAIDPEPARLALRAMLRIAERAAGCGFAPAVAALDHEILLADAARLARDWQPDVYLHVSAEVAHMAAQLALVRRFAGQMPSPAAALRERGALPAFLLAAQGDAAVVPVVAAFPEGAWADAHYGTMEYLGWCVAWIGDGALHDQVRGRIAAFAAGRGIDATNCLGIFDRAMVAAAARLRGTVATGRAEPHSTLAAMLDPDAPGAVPLPVEFRPSLSVIAVWRMTASPIAMSGCGTNVRGRAVRLMQDEYVRDAFYVALWPVGLSRVDMEFALGEATAGLCLSVSMQKGARAALPYAGEARVTLDIDGERLMDSYPIRDDGEVTNNLAVPRLHAGPHAITVQLDPLSTASLRLYEVRMVRRP